MKVKTNWSNLCRPYLCGLIAGNPSQYSATLHNAGYKALNLEFSYHSFKVLDFKVAADAMLGMGLRGYSVTIPFKEDAMGFLDIINSDAVEIDAVNTVVNSGDQLLGFNTDWIGIKNSLLEIQANYTKCSALIVGAGGAAKAAIYALQQMRFNSVVITNRTLKRSKEVAANFNLTYLDTNKLTANTVRGFDVIVNATPQINIDFFPYQGLTKDQILFEMITSETKLTKTGEQIGAKVVHGIRMLLHQGIEQFKIFTEKKPPQVEMEKSLLELYLANQKANPK